MVISSPMMINTATSPFKLSLQSIASTQTIPTRDDPQYGLEVSPGLPGREDLLVENALLQAEVIKLKNMLMELVNGRQS
jgi:hypothetical protein